MRILFSGIFYAPDLVGVAKYNTEICEWLQSRGHEIRVVTAPPYYPKWKIPSPYKAWFCQSELWHGIPIKRVPIYVPSNPTGIKRLIHHMSFALANAWPVISVAYRWRPDLLMTVAPSLLSCRIASFAAKRIGAHSWLHLQDFEVDAAFGLGMLKYNFLHSAMLNIEHRILGSFDRVSTISPQMVQGLQNKGVNPEHIYELRNWVDVDQIVPSDRNTIFRKTLAISDSDIVGLYSGSISNKQGLDVIIESAKKLAISHPHIQFIVCGEGPQKSKLQEMAIGLRNVHFIGLQPDDRFKELLSTADFHLLPQRAKAADLVLPSKLGGIFASGRPVIATAEPGTGLANEVGDAGLVVCPEDAQAFAEAVITMAENEALRTTLGKNARQRALQRWSKLNILHSLERELLTLRGQNG